MALTSSLIQLVAAAGGGVGAGGAGGSGGGATTTRGLVRARRLNPRTRILIKTGAAAEQFEQQERSAAKVLQEALDQAGEESEASTAGLDLEGTGAFVEFGASGRHHPQLAGNDKATRGVDVAEEQELHLQLVLRQSSRRASPTRALGSSSSSASSSFATGDAIATPFKLATKNHNIASIPVPDSAGRVDDATYSELYPPHSWSHPVSYLRFSDTVEDCIRAGVEYTMDEEDEDWLVEYNRISRHAQHSISTRGLGKTWIGENGSVREPASESTSSSMINEDEFELVMDLFEKDTKARGVTSSEDGFFLPSFAELCGIFKRPPESNPNRFMLGQVCSKAEAIYPHWRARRIARAYKPIIPDLERDETQADSAYVCFRHRDPKRGVRKTRASDARGVDRLVQVRNDLFAALTLMKKVAWREKLKLENLRTDRAICEAQIEMRFLKRKLGESHGDEELLARPRGGGFGARKRPKSPTVDPLGTTTLAAASGALSRAGISRESMLQQRVRARAIRARMQDALRARDLERDEWVDVLDDPIDDGETPRATPTEFWRATDFISGTRKDGIRLEGIGFVPTPMKGVNLLRPCYRRRVGRGGRIQLDRLRVGVRPTSPLLLPREASEDEGEEDEEDPIDLDAWARRCERFKYDDDETSELPSSKDSHIVDDSRLDLTIRRASLLNFDDIDEFALDDKYLKLAFEEAARAPPVAVPPEIAEVGPRRYMHPIAPDARATSYNVASSPSMRTLAANPPNGSCPPAAPSSGRSTHEPYTGPSSSLPSPQYGYSLQHTQQQQQHLRSHTLPTPRPRSADPSLLSSPRTGSGTPPATRSLSSSSSSMPPPPLPHSSIPNAHQNEALQAPPMERSPMPLFPAPSPSQQDLQQCQFKQQQRPHPSRSFSMSMGPRQPHPQSRSPLSGAPSYALLLPTSPAMTAQEIAYYIRDPYNQGPVSSPTPHAQHAVVSKVSIPRPPPPSTPLSTSASAMRPSAPSSSPGGCSTNVAPRRTSSALSYSNSAMLVHSPTGMGPGPLRPRSANHAEMDRVVSSAFTATVVSARSGTAATNSIGSQPVGGVGGGPASGSETMALKKARAASTIEGTMMGPY